MKIYFAGSIRGGRVDQPLYADIIRILSHFGEVLTEHVADPKLSALGEDGPTDQYIYTRDMRWLRTASLVIAEVSQASLGVGYEIAKAEELKKKILCIYRFYPNKKISAMISGNNKLLLHEYTSLEELDSIFRKFINKNPIPN